MVLFDFVQHCPRHHPVAEARAFVLALWDGDANGVLAWLQVVEVEVDGIGGRSWTPA